MSDPTDPPTIGRQREVFLAALALTGPAERAAFLDRTCVGDPALREAVEALLREQAELGDFLETPALDRSDLRHDLVGKVGTGDGSQVRPDTESVGDRIGRYRLIEKIGEGGAGVVYLAEQEEPVRRQVALKVLKLGMDTRSVVARFEAERQALALMDHPNIAKVFDAGATAAGRPFFVMELVRGLRITEYCDRNHLPARERLALFIEVCQAIQHAHQKGIIHRDIKPSNILVTLHDGVPVPKVIDFGIAKAIEQRLTDMTLVTAFAAFVGTPAYMSPEQAELSGLDVDTRTDVYSLGILLYELLTGRTPFDPRTLAESGLDECRRTIRDVEPARPSTRLQTLVESELTTTARQRRVEPPQLIQLLRGDLDWVVMKCLEKDRQRRFPAASELAADIQRYLANEPVLARPPSRAYRLGKFVRRHRGVLAAAAGIGLALIAGTAVSTALAVRATRAEREALSMQGREERLRKEAEQERASARLNEYVADINLAQQSIAAGNLGRAVQLVERHRPAPGDPDLRGFEWRHLWQLCQGDDHVSLPDQEASVQCLAVSPDDQFLAIGTVDAFTVWDLGTKTPVHRSTHGAVSMAFLPDGSRLVTADRGAVRVSSVAGWTEQRVLPGSRAPMALAPDGTHLAAASRGGVRIWNTRDWTERQLLPGASGPLAFAPDGRTLAANNRDGITLWSVASGLPGVRLTDSTGLFFPGGWWFGGGSQMTFSPDGRYLVAPRNTASERGAYVLSIWDAATGLEVGVMPGDPERIEHAGAITEVVFARDGRTLATVSMDHSIRLWDFTTRRRTATLHGHRNEVWAVAFSADGARLASGGKDGGVKLWATRREADRDFLPGPTRPIAFSPDGTILAVATGSNTLAFLDALSGQVRSEFPLARGPSRFPSPVSLSADLRTLAHPAAPGAVRLLDLGTGDSTELQVDREPVDFVALSPDARTLVTAGRNQPMRWWDLQTRTNLILGTQALRALYSPEGQTLAVLERGRAVQLRDTATGGLRHRLEAGTELAPPVAAFSADGAWLVTSGLAGADHILEVWDTATGRRLGEYRGHKQGIHSAAFSRDGLTLASVSTDGALKLWNLTTQQELLSFQRPGAHPGDLLFSPDGRVLVAASTRSPGAPGLWFHRAPTFAETVPLATAQTGRNRGPSSASQSLVRP